MKTVFFSTIGAAVLALSMVCGFFLAGKCSDILTENYTKAVGKVESSILEVKNFLKKNGVHV